VVTWVARWVVGLNCFNVRTRRIAPGKNNCQDLQCSGPTLHARVLFGSQPRSGTRCAVQWFCERNGVRWPLLLCLTQSNTDLRVILRVCCGNQKKTPCPAFTNSVKVDGERLYSHPPASYPPQRPTPFPKPRYTTTLSWLPDRLGRLEGLEELLMAAVDLFAKSRNQTSAVAECVIRPDLFSNFNHGNCPRRPPA
jgi:hypothetical protein